MSERKTLDERQQMTDLERLRHSTAHVMATAILRGVINTDCLPHNAIVAYDPDIKREQLLALEFGILCAQSPAMPGSCPRVLLSVKPQVMDTALEAIADVILFLASDAAWAVNGAAVPVYGQS